MKNILTIILLSAVMLVSGCQFYSDQIAPHVPNLSFGIGGSGIEFGISSRWNPETNRRERSLDYNLGDTEPYLNVE